MYSRNRKPDGGLTEEEREIARYGLPPKYDGSRFRRPPVRTGAEDGDGLSEPQGSELRSAERTKGDLFSLLGGEELLIVALILILSGPCGEDGENPSDVILLLALLLTAGMERPRR